MDAEEAATLRVSFAATLMDICKPCSAGTDIKVALRDARPVDVKFKVRILSCVYIHTSSLVLLILNHILTWRPTGTLDVRIHSRLASHDRISFLLPMSLLLLLICASKQLNL